MFREKGEGKRFQLTWHLGQYFDLFSSLGVIYRLSKLTKKAMAKVSVLLIVLS
jgi:hypothetical protein